MQIFVAFMGGLIFGLGLIISGMADPSKVLNFLDLSGSWDPSLAFVMGGAIAIGFIAFHFAAKRKTSLLGADMSLPSNKQIDRRLVFGSLAFGIGWGLAGYCPGPALASLTTGNPKTIIFVIAMLAGMVVFELLERLRTSSTKQSR